jgi:phage shock protein A
LDFLDRFLNVLSGDQDSRKENPQKEIDRLVRGLKQKLTEGRARLTRAIRDGKAIQADCLKLRNEVQAHLRSARSRLLEKDEAGARTALRRKVQAEQLLAEMERELGRQREGIQLLQSSLGELAERVRTVEVRRRNIQVRVRRTRMLAARQEVQESGQLRGAESLLEDLDARLEVEEELLSAGSAGDSLERRFAELEQSGELRVELLEDYRNKSED